MFIERDIIACSVHAHTHTRTHAHTYNNEGIEEEQQLWCGYGECTHVVTYGVSSIQQQ